MIDPKLPPRDAVAAMVPVALPQVLRAYLDLVDAPPSDDPKAIQQHQAACKAALQHLEALIKLLPDTGASPGALDDGLDDVLKRAAAEVDAFAVGATSEEKGHSDG